jgi:hypothetical protein
MSDTLTTIHHRQVYSCPLDGEMLNSEATALELIGEAKYLGADLIIIPVERLDANFFELKTRLAGHIIQKFVTYRLQLVILGDISHYLAESRSFRDFVYEANLGTQIWFLLNHQELTEKLSRSN